MSSAASTASNVLSIAKAIADLAPPVLELVAELVSAVKGSKTKRDAARAAALVAAKRMVWR